MYGNFALSGKMGAGKSTVLKELAKVLSFKGVAIGEEIKPLATSLIEDRVRFEEQIARVIPNKEERDNSLKEIYQFFEENFRHAHWEKDESGFFIKNLAYRKLLQDFPMLVRKHFGEEVFAGLMVAGLDKDIQEGTTIVCDDLRLPNEKTLLEESGFFIIRLDISEEEQKRRLKQTYGTYDEAALKHRTEVALDDASFDLRIDVTEKSVSVITQEIYEFLLSQRAKKIVRRMS